jgi:hypothetical protein
MERGITWTPTTDEIAEIRNELKPLIAELARRDTINLVRAELVRSGPGIA